MDPVVRIQDILYGGGQPDPSPEIHTSPKILGHPTRCPGRIHAGITQIPRREAVLSSGKPRVVFSPVLFECIIPPETEKSHDRRDPAQRFPVLQILSVDPGEVRPQDPRPCKRVFPLCLGPLDIGPADIELLADGLTRVFDPIAVFINKGLTIISTGPSLD